MSSDFLSTVSCAQVPLTLHVNLKEFNTAYMIFVTSPHRVRTVRTETSPVALLLGWRYGNSTLQLPTHVPQWQVNVSDMKV